MNRVVFLLVFIGFVEVVAATDRSMPLVMTLDDYVKKAIEDGVKGRETQLALERAGYARSVTLRQTDSPTIDLTHAHSRGESQVNGVSNTLTDTKTSAVTINETTPLGTAVKMQTLYGDPNKPGFNTTVQQPLYAFVRNSVLRQRRQAELTFQDAQSTFASATLEIRSQARNLYYGVMQAEEAIKVEQRKAGSSQKLLDVTEALVDAGRTAAIEATRARLRVQEADRQLQNAVTQKLQAEISAKNFVFLPLDAQIRFVTQLEFAPLRASLGRLKEYALLHNPQLQSLRRAQEFARLSYEASLEPTRPSLSLNGQYAYNELPRVETHHWQIGWSMDWRVFDSFVTRNQTNIAQIGVTVANLNLADGERSLRVNVYSAYLDVKRTERQIQEFKASREQAAKNVDVLRLRFQNGLDRLIDVFQAEDDMRNLDNEYLGLLVQFNRGKDQLSALVGADVDSL